MKHVFISFAGEDARMAEYLRRTLDHVFSGVARFFASSGAMNPGEVWLNRLRDEATKSDLVLILLSPRSFDKPWINIETGAFWVRGVDLHPLIHGGLEPTDLHRPLTDYQAIDLNSEDGVTKLVGRLAQRFGLSAPPTYDAPDIVHQVNMLDRGGMRRLLTWSDVAAEIGLHATEPKAELFADYEITKEMNSSSFRTLRDGAVELSGYSADSLLFTFRGRQPLGDARFLVIHCENTAATRSLEYGLFMKVRFDTEVLRPLLEYQRHSRDDQFTGLGDGFFPYDISWAPSELVPVIHIVLWRVEVSRLEVRFLFAS